MRHLYKILALLIIGISLAFALPSDKYFDIAKSLDIFATLFKEVNLHYVDEIDPKSMIRVGIDAMLESLDPYTNYIAEEEVESFRSATTGQYAGIGAMIGRIGNRVLVTHPYEDMPANKYGLKVGDEIIEVNGVNVKGKSPQEISTYLKGNAKTEVIVKVNRFGEANPVVINIRREKISVKNVSYYGLIDAGIGYIKLDDFTPGAGKEVHEALNKLKSAGANSIILDLRENPGGMLQEAVNVVNVFIPKGKEVVSTKGKQTDWNKAYYTLNAPADTQIPLAILIGPVSASASEIVAGALQDYDRAVLIGKTTFGKGLVQTTRPLTYNGQLKVTTAKYFIPSGRCIQSLDYKQRDVNGNATKQTDSLRVAFKTKNGRKVFDGSGIEPDLKTEDESLASITLALLSQGLIFDFATEYYYTNKETEYKTFNFTDEHYNYFVNWVKNKNFSYKSATELELEKIMSTAKDDKSYADLTVTIDLFKEQVEKAKKEDFTRFKSQIISFLKPEIAFRYNLVKGQLQETFANDIDIVQANKVLNSSNELKLILTKK
ncbi:MAG TPA: S41 family peptidase [Cyclobacteriaceae bacterium]|nr:S41 family peptidase [Cyclobacteriaceae bacterium]